MFEIIAAFLLGAGFMAFPAHAVGFTKGLRSRLNTNSKEK